MSAISGQPVHGDRPAGTGTAAARAAKAPATANAPIQNRMSGADWLLLTLLSFLWGGSFAMLKMALADLPPLLVVTGRVGIAAAALGVLLAITGRKLPRDRSIWLAFAVMGLLNNLIPWSLYAYAQREISSSLAAILNAATPLSTALLAHFLTTDEKLTPLKFAGVLLGFAGVAVIVGPAALGGLDASVVGQFACLFATVCYGLSGIYGRRFRTLKVPPMTAAFGQLAVTTVMMLPLTLIVDQPWTLPPPGMQAIVAQVMLALVATALPYILFYRILATAGATNIMLVTFLIPIWAVMLGATALGERLVWTHAAGIAIVALGLALIDGRAVARLRRLFPAGRAG